LTSKTSILSCVSQRLSEHPEGDRIHKLLYWAVKGRWEGAAATLNQAPIQELLPQLVEGALTLSDLERQLHQSASQLSKPEKYRHIAGLILSGCRSFYVVPTSDTDCNRDIRELDSPRDSSGEGEDETAASPTAVSKVDRFEVRQFLMKQIPPLKAKISIFSLLRHPFTGQPSDWVELKAMSLDSWMAELVQRYPIHQELEAKLFAQAPQLKALDQGLQVAEAIAQSARFQVP
jgi:hypothetical protein